MESLLTYRSAKHLEYCLKKLNKSLHQQYEAYPEDPESEFTIAAQRTVEAIGLLFSDILENSPNITYMAGAAVLAIELANYDMAQKCIRLETDQLVSEGGDVELFRTLLSKSLKNRKLAGKWETIVNLEK